MLHEDPDPLILIGLHLPATQAVTVRRAFAWAVAEHSGQVRKDGSRLIDHVAGVARNIQRFMRPHEGEPDPDRAETLISAALLHDIVENTDVSLDAVEERFGAEVARLVDAVTNREYESAAESAARACDAGQDALLLRLCDRLDGIRRSPGRPEENRRTFLSTSREVHLALAEEQFPSVAEAIRGAISEAEATLA